MPLSRAISEAGTAHLIAVFAPRANVDVKLFRETSEAMTLLHSRSGGMVS